VGDRGTGVRRMRILHTITDTKGESTMTDDKLENMPRTSRLMTKVEFAAWIATRKEVAAVIDIATAELDGWWELEGDPYGFDTWYPEGAPSPEFDHEGREHGPCFFVRSPESRGWISQFDLPQEKQGALLARLFEHDREASEFRAGREAAGRLIDIENCEVIRGAICDDDPYNIKLAPYPQFGSGCGLFVRSDDSDGWVWEGDLPSEKYVALEGRLKRERLARECIRDNLLDTLRRGGDLFDADETVRAAKQVYGERIVKAALHSHRIVHDESMSAIGVLMLRRGYLTVEHITELLNSEAARKIDRQNAARKHQ
jgi:hypothetical protein